MALLLLAVLAALVPAQGAPEERVDDTEYDKSVAAHVKAFDQIERSWRKDPAASLKAAEAALRAAEADLLPRLARVVESTIAVRVTRGIDKGEIKDRHPFFPYRLAGEIALAAGEPARAAELLEKSPTAAALLAEARKAAALAREKKDPPPPPPPLPPAKPAFDPKPFLDRRDFAGAMDALRRERSALGAEADRFADEIRLGAARHQQSAVMALAGLLPRLDQPEFRKDHLDPCLASCARIPPEMESEELRWVRRLDRWMEKREPGEFERLAIAASKFGPDFAVLCDRAQDDRLREIDRLVQAVVLAERADRPKLLDPMGQAERALGELLAAHDRAEARERLAVLKGKLPIDDKVLDEARTRPSSIADIRRLADELDRLWISDRRAKLGGPEQKELALQLGVYRSMALFLEGRTIAEAAQDLRLKEVFASAGELPADVSPKVAAVRARIGR